MYTNAYKVNRYLDNFFQFINTLKERISKGQKYNPQRPDFKKVASAFGEIIRPVRRK